ncbi:MAG: CooT family nickel-binding protein [Planctomycetes bacterium]|nr:CooT family nickel-binding protein [Planctomycetota bacterium]
MCASDVYLVTEEGSSRRVMEMVGILRPEGNEIYLKNVLGEERRVKARIREVRLVDHCIVLEPVIGLGGTQ